MRRLPTLICALFAVAGLAPAVAHADGDPASDVLLTDTVFLSYSPPSPPVERDLRRVIDAARSAGQPVRVALIASPRDLGAVPDFFGKPAEYARFLSGELAAYDKLRHPGTTGEPQRDPLVIVMPAGIGTFAVPKSVDAKLRKLEPGSGTDGLAAAAGYGVQELARANRKPIAAVFEEPTGAGGGSGALLPLLVGMGLVLLAGVAIVARVRGQGAEAEPQSPGGNK